MPRIIPDPGYFWMLSSEVAAEVRKNRALNCWPCVRSLIHSPDVVAHSPAEIVAAWPTTVTRSRCPRAVIRRTQKPLSALWKVTRPTMPAKTSRVDASATGLMEATVSSNHQRAHSLSAASAREATATRPGYRSTRSFTSLRCDDNLRQVAEPALRLHESVAHGLELRHHDPVPSVVRRRGHSSGIPTPACG